MSVFADASAVVKLYVPESGSHTVRTLADGFYVSAISRVEVSSAMWRKHRMGEMSVASCEVILDAFSHDLEAAEGRLAAVTLSPVQLDHAVNLVRHHALRAYDAVQLAAALAVREVDPSCTGLVTFDRQLAHAASAEGFTVLGD